MAASTVISDKRTTHRAAKVSADSYQGALALDWQNGLAMTLAAGSQVSAVFDATYDRIVFVSCGGASGVIGCWITVGPIASAAASAGAGSQWIAQSAEPVAIYVPANMGIAGIRGTTTAGILSMVPALVAGNGGGT